MSGTSDSKRKLLKLINLFAIGGTENQFVLTASSLDPGRFELHLACLQRRGALLERVESLRCPLVEYPITLVATALVLGIVHVVRAEHLELTHARVARVAAVMCALLAGGVGGKTALGWADLTSDAVFTSRNFFGALRVREQQFATG